MLKICPSTQNFLIAQSLDVYKRQVSTIVAQATGAILAAWFLFRPRSSVDFGFQHGISINVPLIQRILGIGIPASAEMFFWQLASILVFRLVNTFGTVAGAAYQLGLQAEGISYMPAAGFGIAATTLVGRSLGAGDTHLAPVSYTHLDVYKRQTYAGLKYHTLTLLNGSAQFIVSYVWVRADYN